MRWLDEEFGGKPFGPGEIASNSTFGSGDQPHKEEV